MAQKKEPKIEPMADLNLYDEEFREDIIRVIKYGIQHAVPSVPERLRTYLLYWCATEEIKIDRAEGRITMEELTEESKDV